MIGLLVLAAATRPPVIVTITAIAPCHFTVNGVEVAPDELQTALRKRRRKSSRAVIRYLPDTPWRCMGTVMTFAARAKFKKTDFDPPLPKQL